MKVEQVKQLLADRLGSKATDYTPLISEPLELEPSDISDTNVERIRATHELMADFALQMSQHPLKIDQISAAFFQKYTNLLSGALPQEENSLWDAYFAVVGMHALSFSETLSGSISNLREFLEVVSGQPALDFAVKCSEPVFWQILEMLIANLQLDRALELLNSGFTDQDVPAGVFSVVSELANQLKSYPGDSEASTVTKQDFWGWRRSILSIADSATALPLEWGPPIARICAILSGVQDTNNTLHWTQAVICQYAFLNPDPEEWPSYVRQIPTAQPALSGDAPDWECAVARVMSGEVFSAILNLQKLDVTSAVVAAEFYFRANQLQLPFASIPSLREYLALVHALECLECPKLITTGVDMLVNMHTPYSREILNAALPYLGLEAPETRQEALDLTHKLGLTEATTKLHMKIAEYERERLNDVAALKHYHLAGDLKGMRETVWSAFEEMLISGEAMAAPATLKILRSPAPQGLDEAVADCIAPLAILTTILDNASDEADVPIDDAVYTLLNADWVPAKYCPLIIACANSVVVDDSTLAAMMRALARWESDPEEGTKLLEKSREAGARWAQGLDPAYTSKEVINMLRRNLSESVFSS